MVHAHITHKGHKIYLLRFSLRRRLAASVVIRLKQKAKKAGKTQKTCFF
jgi:hypothetical protein